MTQRNLKICNQRLELNDNIRETLFEFGCLRWDEESIASYFGWDEESFRCELQNPHSEIATILKRGELQGRLALESKIFDDAKSGDIDAIKAWNTIMRDRGFKHTKLDLFGAAENSETFIAIQDYYQSGCKGNLSESEQLYLDLLQIVYSFDHQYGKRKTIKILTTAPYNLSYDYAADVYGNAIEMFNSARHNTKAAIRYHIADQLDTLYHAIVEKAECPKDFALAANVLAQKSKLLGLEKEDPETLSVAEYSKTYRLLSLTPESIGLPAANRDILAAQIDSIEDVSETEKERLRMEAGIDDLDIAKILENVTQEKN